jgi:phosphoglycerate dehydrogenase-like enzyme
MIAVMRQIPTMDQTVKNGGWPSTVTSTLHGKTLGIVGLGRIGRHVAKIAAACETKLLAWGRTLTADAAAQVGAECVELDDLMTRSDVISVPPP